MRTTRANPSSMAASTVPVPSTCPCTMWPPRRSLARSGSSRFTWSPAPRGPSDERRSVSAITSARKPSVDGSTAVRQTAFTATESPGPSSAPSGVDTRRRTPSPSSSTASTLPMPATSPVNTRSPLLQPRADQHVVADALDGEGLGAQRGADLVHARPGHRGARAPSAGDDRGHERVVLVDLARVEERSGQARPALQQHRLDLALPEFLEARADALGVGRALHADHLDARGLELPGGGAVGAAGADDDRRDVARGAHELRGERQARRRVEHDAARLALGAWGACSELRVVGQRSADADG